MKIKEIKIVNQDQSTEIADIGADAINVDYNDTTVKDELDRLHATDDSLANIQNNQETKLVNLQTQVNGLESGSPLVASSTSEMTDTTRVYVNTSDGHWYYYTGSAWVAGGIYQSAEDSNTVDILSFMFESSEYESLNKEIKNKLVRGNHKGNNTLDFEETTLRITTTEIISYQFPILVIPKEGYKIAVTELKAKQFLMSNVTKNKGYVDTNYLIKPGTNWYITIKKEDGTEITLEDTDNIYFLPLKNEVETDSTKKNIYETILNENIIDQYIKKCFEHKYLQNYVYEDFNMYLQIPEPLIFDKPIKVKVTNENYVVSIVGWKSKEISQENNTSNTGWVTEYTIPKNTYFTIHLKNVDGVTPVEKIELENIEFSFVDKPDYETNKDELISINGYLSKGFTLKNKVTQNFIPNYIELDSEYGFIGRWFNKTINDTVYKVTVNQGSEIHFKVKNCESINVNWYAMTTGVAYFTYSIDGAEPTRQSIANPLIILPDTEEHIIRITTDGITERIGKWENEIGFAFAGVDIGNGEIKGLMPLNKLIAFYGDSITEGIRTLGIVEEGGDMGETNSASNAYPYFCTQKLNAIPYYIGFGATGITVDGSFQKCIKAIDYFSKTREVDTIYPDLIVINHGTNDLASTNETFKTEYNKVLNKLHIKYPGVKIVCLIPFAQGKANAIRECAEGKEYCSVIETSNWGVTYTSDRTHPDSAGSKIAGEKLAEVIENLI